MIPKYLPLLGLFLVLGVIGCSKSAPADAALFNREAAFPADLPFDPSEWRAVTSFVDRSAGTMATLYGNDPAIAHARTAPQGPYPAGAVLALVTWQRKDDPHWFGARIPARIRSIEFVSVDRAPDQTPTYAYAAYEGTPLAKVPAPDGAALQSRIDALANARAAVLP